MNSGQLDFIREMFDQIAPHYDFLNRLLSLRRDVYWRSQMVKQLSLPPASMVLDVACGTADVALETLHQNPTDCRLVVGVDFAPAMLALARKKIQRSRFYEKIQLAAADAFQLPFKNQSFNAVTIAFGIRNIQDKKTVLDEFYRLLIPSGTLAILELVVPEQRLMKKLYLEYFNKLLPTIGRIFSHHRFAYSYLPESVAGFPKDEDFCKMMSAAGFRNILCRRFTLGIAALFIGHKP